RKASVARRDGLRTYRGGETGEKGGWGGDLRLDPTLPKTARPTRPRGAGSPPSDAGSGDPHPVGKPPRTLPLYPSRLAFTGADPPAACAHVAVGRGGGRPYPALPCAARRSRAERIDLCCALRRLDRCHPLLGGHGGVERTIRRPSRRRGRARRR